MAKANVYFDPNIGAALQIESENQQLPPAAVVKIEQIAAAVPGDVQEGLGGGLAHADGLGHDGGRTRPERAGDHRPRRGRTEAHGRHHRRDIAGGGIAPPGKDDRNDRSRL